MVLRNILQSNSWFNYGTVSPTNLITYVAGYTGPSSRFISYNPSTGSTWFNISYPNQFNTTLNMNLTRTGFTGSYNALTFTGSGTGAGGTGSIGLTSNLYDLMTINNFDETQELWFLNTINTQSGCSGTLCSVHGKIPINTTYFYSNFEIVGGTGYVGIWGSSGAGSDQLYRIPISRFQDNSWHHMAYTYNSSSGYFSGFLDGNLVTTIPITRKPPGPSYGPATGYFCALGAPCPTNMGNGTYANSLIGSYKVYNRSLNPREILQNFNYESRFFSVLTPGNRTTTMDITGLTSLAGVAGQDDAAATIPGINFNFYFFGTNYGNGLNSGIYWSTNNVLGFGTPDSTISWNATTGRGILIGNLDRRTNNFYYSPTLSGSGYNYIKCILYAQNVFNDGTPNAIQLELRFFRGPSNQYVEVRCKQAPLSPGTYNITNGSAFQNTFISPFTNMVANQSFVLASDTNGNNWVLYNNYFINI